MSSEVREFYNHDIIYRFNKQNCILFGMVLDTYESTDPTDTNPLSKGQILVDWGNIDKNYVSQQKKVRLFSRTVVPGDIVRRLETGKETQRGYCRSVQMHANVQIFKSDKVVENVDQHRLKPMYPLSLNAPACLGERFGRIVALTYLITMTGPCGAVLEIKNHLNNLSTMGTCYYLGQTIVSRPSNLGEIRWIKKTKATQRDVPHRFIVEKITPARVCLEVHALQGRFTYLYEVSEQDIPKVQVLEITNDYMTLHESRLLKLLSTDSVLPEHEWIRNQTAKYRPGNHTPSKRRMLLKKRPSVGRVVGKTSKFSYPITIWRYYTKVNPAEKPGTDDSDWSTEEEEEEIELEARNRVDDSNVEAAKNMGLSTPVQLICAEYKPTIIWQDGTEEKDVPTNQLYYSISLDDHEFFCGEWVIRADETLDDYGVVQKVDYLSRTATIKWFTFCCKTQNPIFLNMKEMSVYDIKKHPSFMFRPGSIVHRNEQMEQNLGHVIDSYPDGFVKVKWINGAIEDCWPQHLSFIEDWLEDPMLFSDDEAPSVMSWRTESLESMLGEEHVSDCWRNLYNRLDFMRAKIDFIKENILKENIFCAPDTKYDISSLITLLATYENTGCLDKLLGTAHFSFADPHYQALLKNIKVLAAKRGVQINTKQIVSNKPDNDEANQCVPSNSARLPYLQCNIEETSTIAAEIEEASPLCIQLITMLKNRLDLVFSVVLQRMKSLETVVTKSSEAILTPLTSTPIQSVDTTPDDSFTSITNTPLRYGEDNIDTVDWFGPNMMPTLLDSKPAQKFSECDIAAMNQWFTASEAITKLTTLSLSPNNQPIVSNNNCGKQFEVLDEAPSNHRYYPNIYSPTDFHQFLRAVSKENKLLRESLPPGVWVYTFADRMDLHTVMIRGPDHTPYENGLFIFDLQLSPGYPNTPPNCVYISYNSERLNPNLYVEGRVCVSLLGTWVGRGTEVWRPTSTLLQLIVSIQGLILVAEPYYNEAGYEKQCNSQQGFENSRTYNELVLLRLVQSMTQMIENPYPIVAQEIYSHFREHGPKLIERLSTWIHMDNNDFTVEPHFPLLPVSKGLKLSLEVALNKFQKTYDKYILPATTT